jgi:hypothetical protein
MMTIQAVDLLKEGKYIALFMKHEHQTLYSQVDRIGNGKIYKVLGESGKGLRLGFHGEIYCTDSWLRSVYEEDFKRENPELFEKIRSHPVIDAECLTALIYEVET